MRAGERLLAKRIRAGHSVPLGPRADKLSSNALIETDCLLARPCA